MKKILLLAFICVLSAGNGIFAQAQAKQQAEQMVQPSMPAQMTFC